MKVAISKKLIFDVFANRVTPLQRKQIDDWLRSKENQELYYKWLEEWENRNPEYQPDSIPLIENYLIFVRSTLRHEEAIAPDCAVDDFGISSTRLMAVAAAIAVALFISGIWLYQDSIFYKTYTTTAGETATFLLIDGSQATLAEHSSLKVPRWRSGPASREVTLEGSADFSVKHTPDHRKFIVKTRKGFEVVVLGTEFSVFSRQKGARVVLNKGKVQVNYQEGKESKKLILKPGDLISFNEQNQPSLKTLTHSPNLLIWQEKRFVFEETQLTEVARILEETYGLEVTIVSPELGRRKLMGSFKAENLDELLQTISDLLDISVVRQENRVRLAEK